MFHMHAFRYILWCIPFIDFYESFMTYKYMHLSLNWLFLFFRLLVNPKAMTSTSAFPDTFAHAIHFSLMLLVVVNSFVWEILLKLIEKIFYAFLDLYVFWMMSLEVDYRNCLQDSLNFSYNCFASCIKNFFTFLF